MDQATATAQGFVVGFVVPTKFRKKIFESAKKHFRVPKTTYDYT